MAGLVGTGGAVRALVFSAFHLKTEIFIATSAVVDLGIDASGSVVYWHNGFVHQHDLYLIPILLVVSIIGTYIGKKILNHVSEQQFKNIVLILILLTGLFTLYKLMHQVL
ncbi:sulfite exporter TauE/SafE family protein [Hydrotalea sp.]|uniref:sulfite exporter TauE/SafE family protein n=1 Tax=Hydrotalea sp. TaxID=2881279 RepID=UPI002611E1BF|nr:sulfite exporter TauE/SafE family protein [Hydrotalea sp.]